MKVRKLHIRKNVSTTKRQRNNVINRRRHRIRMLKRPINRIATNLANPTVTLKHILAPVTLIRNAIMLRSTTTMTGTHFELRPLNATSSSVHTVMPLAKPARLMGAITARNGTRVGAIPDYCADHWTSSLTLPTLTVISSTWRLTKLSLELRITLVVPSVIAGPSRR